VGRYVPVDNAARMIIGTVCLWDGVAPYTAPVGTLVPEQWASDQGYALSPGLQVADQVDQLRLDVATLQAINAARAVRIASVTMVLQLGQRDYPVTWSTPFPNAAYKADAGADPLVGKGTAAVVGQTAGGCTFRVNITSLLGLVSAFNVVAWC
jgi:hypothetical protein